MQFRPSTATAAAAAAADRPRVIIATQAILPLSMGDNPGFQFKTHPNINKALFTQRPSALALRDPSRAFPTGSVRASPQRNEHALSPLAQCAPLRNAMSTRFSPPDALEALGVLNSNPNPNPNRKPIS